MSTVVERRDLSRVLSECYGDRARRYEDMLRGFREAGIDFILINLPIHFTMDKKPSDLDLILDENGYAAAARFLDARGYLRLDRQPGPRQVVYVGFDGERGFTRIHLHENLMFYGLTLLTYERALEYTVKSDGFRYADAMLDYYLLHLEWFFKDKQDYPRRIEEVFSRCEPSSLFETGERLFGDRFDFVRRLDGRRRSGVRVTPWLRLAYLLRCGAVTLRMVVHLMRRALSRWDWLLLWRRRGVVLFLMGIDGSGKTTMAREVARQHDTGGLFCHYRYLGLKKTLVQRLRQRLKPNDRQERERGQRGVADRLVGTSILLANLFNLVLSFVYILEYRLRCIGLLHPIRRHNDLVIVDRTYLDKLADLDRWGNKLFYYLLPHPDIVVALHGRPEVLYDRKSEFAVPVLVEMQRRMNTALSFLERRGVRVVRVDTTRHDVEVTAAIVQQNLWRMMVQR